MKATDTNDKQLLLLTATEIARELKQRAFGTSLRIRAPGRISATHTNGWSATIGDLGKHSPRLQVWLDHFTRCDGRRFWFGFYTDKKKGLGRIAAHAAGKLRPHRTVTYRDVQEDAYTTLITRLKKSEFCQPILEHYASEHLYGAYDPTKHGSGSRVSPECCARAAAFFESVARTLPRARPESSDREIYPRVENRTAVALHLRRERSRLLATERKLKDQFTCCVCGAAPADVYGEIGRTIVEAHHKRPLASLKAEVLTSVDDLITVCPNCHRALHKMSGTASDIPTLRRHLRRHSPSAP